MTTGRRRRLRSGQGGPGGRGTPGAPSPERRALPRHRRLRHTRRRRASTADRREMAAAGVLLQEAVGGGHQVLHLRQRAAGRIQRGQAFQVPAGGATISPPHQPLAIGHIPVPPPHRRTVLLAANGQGHNHYGQGLPALPSGQVTNTYTYSQQRYRYPTAVHPHPRQPGLAATSLARPHLSVHNHRLNLKMAGRHPTNIHHHR